MIFFFASLEVFSQQNTFCNPINIDYGYTPFDVFSEQGKHRTTADPVIINFKETYYLFSTNQTGYWWSDDLLKWNFISQSFLLPRLNVINDLNAPGVFTMNDFLYIYGSSHDNSFPIFKSKNPKAGEWEVAIDSLKVGAWDPAFFYDKELNKLYLYWGSSNEFPILGTELDVETFQSDGFVKPLISLHYQDHGWERFGKYNDNTFLLPFIEGAWMTKYKNNYYLQYAAPGTEFDVYADGVYVSKNPLDGFQYQNHNPFCYKPTGFVNGAGHGATFQDNYGAFWRVVTSVISVKNNFERRIAIFPAGFDTDDVMFCNTAYGDYPQYLPNETHNHLKGNFVGWMLLNYQKPVEVSSTYGGFQPNFAVDEDIKTYWCAKTSDKGEFITTDLGEIAVINALQVNYADQDVDFMGKTLKKFHQYKIWKSNDKKHWSLLTDKSKNNKDVPHDYVELAESVEARYIKLENIQMPGGRFAISGLRVFGKSNGLIPPPVEHFTVLRSQLYKHGERWNAWLKWEINPLADGYVIYFGKSPQKLYGSIMIYAANQFFFTGMDRMDTYYFQIEAFNSAGISERSEIIQCQ